MSISLLDEEVSYLLSDEVKSKLRSFNEDKIDAEIDIRKLMEFAFEREKRLNAGAIASMEKAGISERTITRIIYKLVYENYKNELDCIVAAFKRSVFILAPNKMLEEEAESRILYQQKKVEREFRMAACVEPEDASYLEELNKTVRKGGGTALHVAAENGNMEQVKVLVANGIDISIRDNARMTAATLAKNSGFFEISRYLNNISL